MKPEEFEKFLDSQLKLLNIVRIDSESAFMARRQIIEAFTNLHDRLDKMKLYTRHGRTDDCIMCERTKGEDYPCTCELDELMKEEE